MLWQTVFGIITLGLFFPKKKNMKFEYIANTLPQGIHAYPSRLVSTIDGIVVHHTATNSNATPQDIAHYHVHTKGWPGIAYHFLIYPNGQIYQTNALDKISYHVANNNTKKVGICLVGNFEKTKPSPDAILALDQLINYVKKQCPNINTIKPHGALVNTQCPGVFLNLVLKKYEL